MRTIFSIEFEFKGRRYLGIVRAQEKGSSCEYHVRVMNSRLDNWLYGYHIFHLYDSRLQYDAKADDERTASLQIAVHDSLQNYLQYQAKLRALNS